MPSEDGIQRSCSCLPIYVCVQLSKHCSFSAIQNVQRIWFRSAFVFEVTSLWRKTIHLKIAMRFGFEVLIGNYKREGDDLKLQCLVQELSEMELRSCYAVGVNHLGLSPQLQCKVNQIPVTSCLWSFYMIFKISNQGNLNSNTFPWHPIFTSIFVVTTTMSCMGRQQRSATFLSAPHPIRTTISKPIYSTLLLGKYFPFYLW